jgi:hypothetical protein
LPKFVSLSEETVEVLLDHVSRGAAHPQVGFEDAAMTKKQLHNALIGRAVRLEALESALWSCNLLDELGQFRHTIGFREFVATLTPPGYKFDGFFNVFLEESVCSKN